MKMKKPLISPSACYCAILLAIVGTFLLLGPEPFAHLLEQFLREIDKFDTVTKAQA